MLSNLSTTEDGCSIFIFAVDTSNGRIAIMKSRYLLSVLWWSLNNRFKDKKFVVTVDEKRLFYNSLSTGRKENMRIRDVIEFNFSGSNTRSNILGTLFPQKRRRESFNA
jgi:hypothetical protein